MNDNNAPYLGLYSFFSGACSVELNENKPTLSTRQPECVDFSDVQIAQGE